ncbi:SDR family NAD(P)-dependent oxidoreductase [Arthrobacter sp. NPDC090010]|uniref:SDR family NAD(P)-dependent oxidoreductase n=1 Tax=Arthrobacter sp. NPDC090010 TaxID=3363942 RepID=UPI00381D636A
MKLDFRGRRALVTGAASGIGRAVCRALLAEGCTVFAFDRDASGLSSLARDGSVPKEPLSGAPGGTPDAGTLRAVVVELCEEQAVREACDELAREAGALDLLVSCAGVSGPVGTPLELTQLDAWRQVMDVNVLAPFLLFKHTLPLLREGHDPAVVLLASDSAVVTAPGMAPYCASKAALVQLGRAAAVEWERYGIRVNSLCPSVVDTPMSRGDLGLPHGFSGSAYPVQTADDVAGQVLVLLSPLLSPVTGTALLSDFGYSARSGFPA